MDYIINLVDCPDDVDESLIESVARQTLAATGAQPGELTIAFFDDAHMQELNHQFREKDYPTDVLSFPLDPDESDDSLYFGDIAISLETAEVQAEEQKHSLETELLHLTLHGVLHLTGHDHEADSGEMDALELDLRDKFFPDNT